MHRTILTACVVIGWLAALAPAQESHPEQSLTVGVKVAAPFAMKDEQGEWHGISLDLWRRIAEDLDLTYELVEYDLEGMIDAVAAGEADAGVAATTVTAEREERLDFSHPFYHSGLGIAIIPERGGNLGRVVAKLFSLQFFTAVLALGALLLGVGLLVWLVERKRNAEQFGGAIKGLGSGFWWSAVTMTTVGYGDKAPITVPGRLIGLVWMFASIIIISGFTAAIASALTVSSLGSDIAGPADLPHARVGTVAGSAAETRLRMDVNRVKGYETIEAAVQGLRDGEVDATVYDSPILKYTVSQAGDADVAVLPVEFEPQDYAIILPPGSDLREPINMEMLRLINSDDWDVIVARYLGQ